MAPKKNKFIYGKSVKIIHWGCSFDSLLELKFAISIQEEYEFVRERVSIFYHNCSLQPTNYIKEGVLRYTPDFLVRNKHTGEAFLIEIKPRAAQDDPQLELRRKVAENYIKWKGYDWQFKIIFDDEIILDEAMLEIFEDCCQHKSKSDFKIWLQELNRRYDRSAPTFFARVPNDADIRFLMFGERSSKRTKINKEN